MSKQQHALATAKCYWTVASVACAAVLATACATTQVLVEAPEAFWITIESIILALFDDAESLLLLFGL